MCIISTILYSIELDYPQGGKLFSKQPGRAARVAKGSGT